MTLAGDFGMGSFTHTRRPDAGRPRDRLRAYLEERFRGRPGSLAQEVGIGPKAAENLLLGHWPSDTTLSSLLARFGRDLKDALFEPDIDPVLARLAARERQAREEYHEALRLLSEAKGGPAGAEDPVVSAAEERDPLTGDLLEWGGLQ
jgi:hypothetical protein